MSSEREQFGLVLVEGMACRIPALAPRLLGPRSIVEDGRTGWLYDPDDETALSRALIEAASDPAERARRGRLAREHVCERFSWSGISASLARVFDEVSQRSRPSQPAAQP